MNHFEKILACFSLEIQKEIAELQKNSALTVEEIRVYREKGIFVYGSGKKIKLEGNPGARDIVGLLNSLLKFSYYAYEEDLAKGFVTVDGGHRVGVCGKAVVEDGRVTLIRDISSLNIRLSRQIKGCSDEIMPAISAGKTLHNTLIVSPPGCGKTTLLRDIARNLSDKGFRTAICDERSEIAGMYNGVSAYDLGETTDVLDGCPKAEGMIMLTRAMSPQVIITDEISREKDAEAIRICAGCGVKVVASAHGESFEDLRKSEIYPLVEKGIFSRLVFLTNVPKVGTVKEVRHV